MTRKFKNHKGELVPTPKDLQIVLVDMYDGTIVWSRSKNYTHQVRYGLQATQYSGVDKSIKAADDFGQCVRHYLECEGMLN